MLMFFCVTSYSQNNKVEKILAEGKLLYRLEKGAWYGTDHFMAYFAEKMDLTTLEGYLSYETPYRTIKTIIYSKYNSNEVLVSYEFDSLPQPTPIRFDTVSRQPTSLEKDLIMLRQEVRRIVAENKDNFFTLYENTGYNYIPIITNNQRVVFILTGSLQAGVVLIGNDYKLKFNENNTLVNKEKIHKSI